MSHVIAFERFSLLADEPGTPTLRLSEWIEEMTRAANFSEVEKGSGSPEGVVTASPTKLYMDTAGTAGNILYVKKSGNGDTGWILV